MKKVLSFILALTMVLSILNIPAYAGPAFAGGDGTSGNPYKITTWTQLNEVRNYLGSYFILMNDLDGNTEGYNNFASSAANGGLGWTPIGNYSNQFTGHFDGNGNTISGLNINRTSEESIGLFGRTNTNAEISNVKLKNVNVKGKSGVGGLVGWAENTIISKSSVTGNIIGSNVTNAQNVGGLVGYNYNGKIATSYVDANVTGYTIVGGLVGYNYGEIINCYARGNVNATAITYGTYPIYEVGGLVGVNTRTITNCYAAGTVTGTAGFIGGLVGFVMTPGNVMASFFDTSTTKFAAWYGIGGKSSYYAGTIQITGTTTASMKTKTTFTSKGWDFNNIWTIDESTSYPYFKYDINKSTVTYNKNGGSSEAVPNTQAVEQNKVVTTLPIPPTKTGYTFNGWNTATDGSGSAFGGTTPVTKNVIVYAQWTPNIYKTTFDINYEGGKASSEKYFEYDSTYGTEFPDGSLTREGYTFEGWYTSKTGGDLITRDTAMTVANDQILYAHWTGDSITVDFDIKGGVTTPSSINVTVGEKYVNLPTITEENEMPGYDFDGWYTSLTGGTKITNSSNVDIPKSHTLYARWAGERYKVNFITQNTDTEKTTPSAISVTYGAAYYELPTFNTQGESLKFDGWYTEPSTGSGILVTSFTTVTTASDHTLYAHWSENESYTVGYSGNGNTSGQVPNSERYYSGADVTVFDKGNLARTGYIFKGWSTSSTGTAVYISTESIITPSTFTVRESDVTLYAVWEPIKVTVIFDSNGSNDSPNPNTILVEYDSEYGTLATIEKTGYDFLGWLKEQTLPESLYWDATTKNWDTTNIDKYKINENTKVKNPEDHTLFAQWVAKIFDISYDPQGGAIDGYEVDAVSGATAIYDKKYGQLKTATRDGYTFDGWFTAPTGGSEILSTDTVKITANQDLYARWTANTDTPYKIEHYQQDIAGSGYTLIDYENLTGTTDTTVTVDATRAKIYKGFSENTVLHELSGSIKGDGTLSLKLYYDRNTYNVEYHSDEGSSVPLNTEVRYEGRITQPTTPTRPGYNFVGWYADEELTYKWDFNNDIVTANTTLYAKWKVISSGSKTEQIKVDVETGRLGKEVVNKTFITRITDANGTKLDQVNFAPDSAKDALKSITDKGQSLVRIVIPDAKDEVSRVDFTLPKDTSIQISDAKVDLEIHTENVKIQIPSSSLENINQDLYFRLVPIKEETKRREVEERAKAEKIVKDISNGQNIYVVARPMTIETNMQSRAVTLVLPLLDVVLPTNSEERDKSLSDLVIFIEHTDGDKELVKPQLVEYKEGMHGLQFGVNKFSTFTIMDMEGWNEYLKTQVNHHNSYIKGYTDGTFKPEKSISRAEMAAILARNLGYDAANAVSSSYPDLQATHWALKEIEFVKTTGLMIGDIDGNFRPDSPITRGEMAAIAARYKELVVTTFTKSSFSDVDMGYWGVAEIEAVRTAGIVDGYKDNTYLPHNNLTRAEAVKIVNRLFERGPLYGVSTPSWPDVPSAHWSYMEVEEASQSHDYVPRQLGGEDIVK